MTFSSLKKTWISYPNYFLCHGFCENWLGGSGEKNENCKRFRDGQAGGRRTKSDH